MMQSDMVYPTLYRIYKIVVGNLLLSMFLIFFFLLMGLIFHLAFRTEKVEKSERMLRIASLFMGFMLYYVSRQVVFSVPYYILVTYGITAKSSNLMTVSIFTFLFSILFALFMLFNLKRGSNISFRIAILGGAWVISLFIDMFVLALSIGGITQPRLFVPNYTFISGLVLFMILIYDKKDAKPPDEDENDENLPAVRSDSE